MVEWLRVGYRVVFKGREIRSMIMISFYSLFILQYLKRRCITDQECSRINLTDPSSKKSLHGKRLDRECVLECPKGYEEVEENGVSICRKCEGQYAVDILLVHLYLQWDE